MTFGEALKILNIEDYKERIFHSHSHGELYFLADYIQIAEQLKDPSWFRDWFIQVIEKAEKEWERPESVFQHIIRILNESSKIS